MVTTAVILAAGIGSRFGDRTARVPKGFVAVRGQPMIVRSVEILAAAGIERIIIGTGHAREHYEALAGSHPGIECWPNDDYASTNSMWTLHACRDRIGADDFLLLESDLVYEDRAIRSLLDDPHDDIMLVADETKVQDQYFVERDANQMLVNCSTDRRELSPCGEMVGIHKVSRAFFSLLCDAYEPIRAEQPRLGYEYALLDVARRRRPMYVLVLPGLKWYEIDDERDLEHARTLGLA